MSEQEETPASPDPHGVDPVEIVMLRAELDRVNRRLEELMRRETVSPHELRAVKETVQSLRAQRRIVPPVHEFYAQITGYGASGTPYKWKELWATSAGLTTFTSGISCTATSDSGAAIEANGQTFIASGTNVWMRRYENASACKFVFTAPVKPPAASVMPGTIQSSTAGGSDTDWVYTILLDDGRTVSAKNGMEPGEGSPGRMGIHIDSDGTLTGSSCVEKPLGDGAYVLCWQDSSGQWWFSVSNNAEAP